MGLAGFGFVRVIRPQLCVTDDRTAAAEISMFASSDRTPGALPEAAQRL